MNFAHTTPRFSLSSFSTLLVASVCLCLLIPVTAEGKNPIRQAFFNAYPGAVGTVLDDSDDLPNSPRANHCGVCHYDFNGGGARNLYGQAVEAERASNGNDSDAAIQAVRFLDSDGDGYTNEVEITDTTSFVNTPTFPGLNALNVLQVQPIALQGDLTGYLVPSTGSDTEPPEITILQPNGGEVITANTATNITWTASDASGVAGADIYLSLDNGATYRPIQFAASSGDPTNSYAWIPANRPSSNALIQIVAVDNASNSTNVFSAGVFTIISPTPVGAPTTLRDFDMPGTQPLELTADLSDPQIAPEACAECHGGYDPNAEPYFNWQGSMMAHASIDPLFEANLVIANQDAAESGDLCLRCHTHAGWVQGRSVPTDGSSMLDKDKHGVSCSLCHGMLDPIYEAGVSPIEDLAIITNLLNPGTNFASAMVHLDPQLRRRGPFSDTVAPHQVIVSPFHREAAFCGTCHNVSNPVYERDTNGVYQLNALDTAATDMNPHKAGVVERTYSEWLASDFNTPQGVYLPEFAGSKTNGFVATCQDCHMRDVVGYGCNDTNNVPLRQDMPLHDMTGHSTWLPLLLVDMYTNQVNAAAITAGVARATQILTNAADMVLKDGINQLMVTITNNCGHKLPTGYPEGRRMWINVQFFDTQTNLVGESGAYDANTGVLSHDAEAEIYEVHPGIDSNMTNVFGLPEGPSFHFVLNNKTFEDNRIPPRGFTNAAFAAFGGAPVGYSYADGQYWDDTLYTVPPGTKHAEVKLYFQSTSKEFVEFLRDENVTNTKGQEMYDLWNDNGKCPPTTMQEGIWVNPFLLASVAYSPAGVFRMDFHCRPGTQYTIQYTDALDGSDTWHPFVSSGTKIPPGDMTFFEDDFTSGTSGSVSATGMRFYRVSY